MKSKLIKIGILLPLCFFSSFFMGCDVTDIKELYVVKSVEISYSGKEEIILNVISGASRSIHVNAIKKSSGDYLWATGVRILGYELEESSYIKNFKITTLPDNISLKEALQNKEGKSVADFVTEVNAKVTPINSSGDAKESSKFHFKETKEGKVFADTTKIIHLD